MCHKLYQISAEQICPVQAGIKDITAEDDIPNKILKANNKAILFAGYHKPNMKTVVKVADKHITLNLRIYQPTILTTT